MHRSDVVELANVFQYLETESHVVQAGLRFGTQLRMTLNSCASALSPKCWCYRMCHYAGWQMCWSNDHLYKVFTEVSLPSLLIVLGHKYLEKTMEWSALACGL